MGDKADSGINVDSEGKATEIKLCSFKRPHMRAFHFAWFSFFLAFTMWFSFAPLMAVVRDYIGICDNDTGSGLPDGEKCKCGKKCKGAIGNANICSVASTIFVRLVAGGWCDSLGPRTSQCILLGVFVIPVLLGGAVTSGEGLAAIRFFIGAIGATFVVTQYWTSVMFSKNVVGTANATSAGWGNLGGGFTQIFMPAVFNMFMAMGVARDTAWRVSFLVPGILGLLTALSMWFFSEDCPGGNYRTMARSGNKSSEQVPALAAFLTAAKDPRVWVLVGLYGACFGTELVMNNVLALHFYTNFGLSLQMAGVAASLFGLMNLFARSLGGILSDILSKRFALRGRIWAMFLTIFFEGIALIVFSYQTELAPGLVCLIWFSSMVQMAEGAEFAIVPYVGRLKSALGAVSGLVGAGGNMGAVTWSWAIYRQVPNAFWRFRIHGMCVIGLALLTPLFHYPEFGSMFLPKTKDTNPDGTRKAEGGDSEITSQA